MDNTGRVDVFETTLRTRQTKSVKKDMQIRRRRLTNIWYKKYWINCFSNGREVNSR